MEWIKRMPKMELHCHLDGSLRIESVKEMLEEQGIRTVDMELRRRLQVSPECKSLTEYLEKFDLPLRCLQEKEGLRRGAFELVEDAARENVKYIEVRFAPMLSVQKGLDCRRVIESVVEGLEEAGKRYAVYTSAIVCAMRHHSLETNIGMLKVAREFLGSGVCALDLAGDESAFPTSGFEELFAWARKWDMPFTIHSGECGSVENVKSAIEFGAKRLGHGIALWKSPELQMVCRERRIGIEMCPTSNSQTKAVESYENYPLGLFLENHLLVSINTDNRTVSNTTMKKEIKVMTEELHREKEMVKKCMENAVETAFAGDDVKHKLLKELNQ